MSDVEAMALLEAFLFAAGDPIERHKLAELLDVSSERLDMLLDQLKRRYQIDVLSGLRLSEINDKVALATKVELGESLALLFEPTNRQDLSQASYEVLAVIAYSEPVTRSEIEMVRGVNSDSIVSRLIDRGLVEQRGHLDVPGRPGLLYVSEQFLADFGLKSTQDLEAVDLLMYDEASEYEDEETERKVGLIAAETDSADVKDDESVQDPLVIAIDGPSGAGKSTLAKELASRLSILFVDTGAMYRALGLKALRLGLEPSNELEIEQMLTDTDLDVELSPEGQRTYVDGVDYTDDIRTPEVSLAASAISALSVCRHYCVELQRELAARQSLILDGRDIGTYVLPNATVKFFITASPEVRARRRYEEMQAKGDNGVYEDVLQEMIQRDHNDSNRALAPTKQAEDAILIDTDGRSIAELIEEMLAVIEQKINDNNDDTE
ncbi:MAG: (d)CMP kinase [Saccharofermentanales bacterium]|nr:(d)CMP kinase [Eubacteriales bacterium]MDD3610807.1 (d)CMP kinase [Eubacteriales bacterium]